MIILIDSNEKATNPSIVRSIEKKFSTVIVTQLPCADVNIPLDDGGILAVERKTCNDFLSSIADGRIFEQVERMAQQAKYSAFVVTGYFTYAKNTGDVLIIDNDKMNIVHKLIREGTKESFYEAKMLMKEIDRDSKTNWKSSAVKATIRVIQYSGCAIEFCSVSDFPDVIAELYTTVNKPDERRGIQKHRIITFPPVDDRVEFIAQLPGVGLNTAEALLKFAGMMDKNADADGYGTLASALHWMSILSQIDKGSRPKGWGAAKILTLRKFFGLASNQYIKVEEE